MYQYEKLTDIISDSTSEVNLKKTIFKFWWGMQGEYAQLSELAIKIFLSFPTTYLCEAGFSSYTSAKTTYHTRLNTKTYEDPAVFF